MSGIPPLTKQQVPWRRVRDVLNNVIIPQINRQRPINDGLVELLPNGFRVRRPSGGGGYEPPFNPTRTVDEGGTTSALTIKPGWINAPKKGGLSTGEINEYMLYPWMPKIVSTALNADPAPELTLEHDETNYVECLIVLNERTTNVGASEATSNQGAGSRTNQIGVSVQLPAFQDSVPGSVSGVQATVPLINKSYDVQQAPVFSVNQVGFTSNTETNRYIPWGKYTLDSEGTATVDEWYFVGDRDLTAESFLTGGEPNGWNPGGGTVDDTTANPKLSYAP